MTGAKSTEVHFKAKLPVHTVDGKASTDNNVENKCIDGSGEEIRIEKMDQKFGRCRHCGHDFELVLHRQVPGK